MAIWHIYLASTSVDTRPGTIFRISVPNNTTNLSIANETTASLPLKQYNTIHNKLI